MGEEHEAEIVHRTLDPESDEPAIDVVTAVADLEGRDPAELTRIWDCIDGVLGEIFSNPPSPDAQVEVTFSYEGYRVTVEQNGQAKFVKIG